MPPNFKNFPYNPDRDQVITLAASRLKEGAAPCHCCGWQSKIIWGTLGDSDKVHGAYLFHWTPGRPDHPPHIDLILGQWGYEASPSERVLVTIQYLPRSGGGTFHIIDSRGRPADDRKLCGRALSPDESAAPGMSRLVATAVTSLWLTEPAIDALHELDQFADGPFASR